MRSAPSLTSEKHKYITALPGRATPMEVPPHYEPNRTVVTEKMQSARVQSQPHSFFSLKRSPMPLTCGRAFSECIRLIGHSWTYRALAVFPYLILHLVIINNDRQINESLVMKPVVIVIS